MKEKARMKVKPFMPFRSSSAKEEATEEATRKRKRNEIREPIARAFKKVKTERRGVKTARDPSEPHQNKRQKKD